MTRKKKHICHFHIVSYRLVDDNYVLKVKCDSCGKTETRTVSSLDTEAIDFIKEKMK